MVDIKKLRENPDYFKKASWRKGYKVDIEAILELDNRKRDLISQIDNLRHEAKTAADSVRNKISNGADQRNQAQGILFKEQIRAKENELKIAAADFNIQFSQIPNSAFDEVPDGAAEKDNRELRIVGEKRKFSFEPKDHLELAQHLDLLDFEAGAKISGSQFYFLKNEAAFLELALAHYALDLLYQAGFKIIFTPDIAKERFYLGTGYLPKGEEAQIYQITDTDLGLIATAEVALAGYHADEILDVKALPLKYAGFSHCFRKEAGAYGKYSKGLYRVHQFSKVEMFCYTQPEESQKIHQELLNMEEKIFQGLGIPYRVIEMCAGDLGAQAAKKYDLEAWLPGRGGSTGSPQGDWGEITSTSNTTDYQARNLNIKYRLSDGAIDYVHTLNGTALAVPRTIIALLENYQRADGGIDLPKVLHKYLPFKNISARK